MNELAHQWGQLHQKGACQHCHLPIVYGPTDDREPHWRHAVPVRGPDYKWLTDYYVGCRLSATPVMDAFDIQAPQAHG